MLNAIKILRVPGLPTFLGWRRELFLAAVFLAVVLLAAVLLAVVLLAVVLLAVVLLAAVLLAAVFFTSAAVDDIVRLVVFLVFPVVFAIGSILPFYTRT
ncbi:MAG: hypothetical protein V3U27_10180 [Candidatus Tectomicrobia bacterium]